MFRRRCGAMHQLHRDIAAQECLALVAQAGEKGVAEGFHAGDGGGAQQQTKKENAKAGHAAAQFAPRETRMRQSKRLLMRLTLSATIRPS